jgi:hypothetical protein
MPRTRVKVKIHSRPSRVDRLLQFQVTTGQVTTGQQNLFEDTSAACNKVVSILSFLTTEILGSSTR